MSKLELLLAKAMLAKQAAEAEMLRVYPVGSEIQFTIMHGQRNASSGVVTGAAWRTGHLRVKHHEAKPNSRYAYRDVHISQVFQQTPNVQNEFNT